MRTLFVIIGLAGLGVIVGGGLGFLAGMAFVILTNVPWSEGLPGFMVFYGFVPIGAFLGMIAIPLVFGLWRYHRR